MNVSIHVCIRLYVSINNTSPFGDARCPEAADTQVPALEHDPLSCQYTLLTLEILSLTIAWAHSKFYGGEAGWWKMKGKKETRLEGETVKEV